MESKKGGHKGMTMYCSGHKDKPGGNFKDLAGETFGRLTVLRLAGFMPNSKAHWLCVCSCGKPRFIVGSSLTAGGRTQSCGCLHREKTAAMLRTHNGSNTRLYRIWAGMKSRCLNEKGETYHRWGGRGIDICDEWINDFAAFKAWALSHGYRKDLSIERADNNKGYSPDNCKWADNFHQANNRRSNRHIELRGKCLTLAQWARETGLSETAISLRLDRYGWSVEKALMTKSRIGARNGK